MNKGNIFFTLIRLAVYISCLLNILFHFVEGFPEYLLYTLATVFILYDIWDSVKKLKER